MVALEEDHGRFDHCDRSFDHRNGEDRSRRCWVRRGALVRALGVVGAGVADRMGMWLPWSVAE